MLKTIMLFAGTFKSDEEGATAIEYGLIAALIAVVIITGVAALGGNLEEIFDFISGELDDATTDQGVDDNGEDT